MQQLKVKREKLTKRQGRISQNAHDMKSPDGKPVYARDERIAERERRAAEKKRIVVETRRINEERRKEREKAAKEEAKRTLKAG